MGNSVEILFEIDKDQNGRTTLRQVDRDLSNIGETAKHTGAQVDGTFARMSADVQKAWREVEAAGDRAGKATEGSLRRAKREARDYVDTIIDAKLRLEDLEREEGRLKSLPDFANRQLPVSLSQRGFHGARPHTGGTGLNIGAVTEADAFKFREQQIAFERQMRLVTQDGGAAGKLEKTAQGLNAVRSGLLGISGIPKGEALGGLLELAGAGGGIGLVIGGAVAGVTALTMKVVELRREQERLFKEAAEGARKFGELTNGGGRGNLFLSEADQKTNEIREFLRDLDKGRTLGVSPDTLTLNEKIKKLTDGAARNEDDLRAASIVLNENRRDRELKKFQLGDKDNIFDRARDGLSGLASDGSAVRRLTSDLDKLRQEFSKTGDVEEYGRAIGKLKERMEAEAQVSREASAAHAEFTQRQESFKNTLLGARENIRQLSSEVDGFNLAAKIIGDAEERIRSFKESVKGLPDFVRETKIEQFVNLIERKKGQDLFKESLGQADRLTSLFEEQAKIGAGLGGQAIRDGFKDRDAQRDAIMREIEQRRGAGTLSNQEQLSLLDKMNSLDNVSKLDRLEREFTARKITLDKEALAQAGADPLKQSLALDRLLQHTSDISRLTEDQISIRADALSRRIELEGAAQQKAAEANKEAADTNKEAADTFNRAASFLEQLFKKGFGVDVQIKDDGMRSRITGSEPNPFDRSN